MEANWIGFIGMDWESEPKFGTRYSDIEVRKVLQHEIDNLQPLEWLNVPTTASFYSLCVYSYKNKM